MNNTSDNEREKLLLHSLKDVVLEQKTKLQTLQTTVNALGNPPTKTSDLTNDSGFITNNDLPTVPTKTSDLQNDSGFLTTHQDISGKENTTNKTTTIDENSTNTQYPTALAVFNLMEENMIDTTNIENNLDSLDTNMNSNLHDLTVAIRGIGADFTQVDAEASDVKSGKKFFDDDGVLQTGTIPTYDGSTNITANGTLATANKLVASDLTVAVPRPQLNAPTLSLSGNTLTVTPPSTNGNYTSTYKIYSNNTLLCTISSKTVDLSDYITTTGTFSITAKCCGTNFEDSLASSSITYAANFDTTLTNITQISALNTQPDTSIFNTSTQEKLPFMAKNTNGPTAIIYFRQSYGITLTPTITLQLYLADIPSGTTSLPCNIKLNDTTISSSALTVVSGQNYQASITLANLSSQAFNKLEIAFNDSTLASMMLRYVGISISNTQNCIILNRDNSFSFTGMKGGNGTTMYITAGNYVNNEFKYEQVTDNTLSTFLNPPNTFSQSSVTNAFNHKIFKTASCINNSFTTLATYIGPYSICYQDCATNNLYHFYEYTNRTFSTNVFDYSVSLHNGEVKYSSGNSNPIVTFIFGCNHDGSTFLGHSTNSSVNYSFNLSSSNLPNEFYGACGIEDWYMRQRTVYVDNVGYILLHKSGTILFFPQVNNSYCLPIGKGRQVNAYLSEDALKIDIYYNIDETVYKKTLYRSSIGSNWIIKTLATALYDNDNSIMDKMTGIKDYRKWYNSAITLDTNGTWQEI